MKHVKELILERRNIKDYAKYNDIVKKKFENINYDRSSDDVEKILIYEEDGEITITLKLWISITKKFIDHSIQLFGNIDYRIDPANGSQVTIYFYNVPKTFFKQLDLELETQKYNL